MSLLDKSFLIFLLLTQLTLIGIPLALAEADAPANNGAGSGTSGEAAKTGTSTSGDSAEQFNVTKFLKTEKQEQSYLKSENPIASFIIQIVNFLVLTISSMSFLAIIIGGITYVTSHGNETQINKGKEIVTYAIIGLVIALSAFFITAFVQSLFYEK